MLSGTGARGYAEAAAGASRQGPRPEHHRGHGGRCATGEALPQRARLAAAQAAPQQLEADFQALRASLRAKENEALQLEVRMASQTTRLADVELAGREAFIASRREWLSWRLNVQLWKRQPCAA